MVQALDDFRVRGVKTNLPFLARVMHHPDFKAGNSQYHKSNLRGHVFIRFHFQCRMHAVSF